MPDDLAEPRDDDLTAPASLVHALAQLHRERVFVPEAVDAAILRRSKRRLSRKPVRWLAAAAAAVLAGWLMWAQFGREIAPGDVNRDGRIDMRDALVLARRIAAGETSAEWDLNHDGVTDQRDADLIAREAVKLPNRGTS
jgi:hypothetical protein